MVERRYRKRIESRTLFDDISTASSSTRLGPAVQRVSPTRLGSQLRTPVCLPIGDSDQYQLATRPVYPHWPERISRADPRFVEWIESIQLPNGNWARFIELHTGKPLYYDRGRIRVDSLEELSEERRLGYGYQVDLRRKLIPSNNGTSRSSS